MAEEGRQPTFLGTRSEAGQNTRGGFSKQAQTPVPSLRRSFKKSTDTMSPALEMGAKIGAETYVGIQQNKIEQQTTEVQEAAYKDSTGQMSPHEMQQLERSNAMFKKYANARRQGAMTDTAADIAIESEIKRVANQFPALGPQVRRAAAQSIGFDPTGTEYEFLTASRSNGASQSETGLQKAVREAEYFAAQTGTDPKIAKQRVLKQYQREQEIQTLEYQDKVGAMATGDIINYANMRRDRMADELTSQLYASVSEGDLSQLSPERVKGIQAQATSMMHSQTAQLRQNLMGQQGMTASQVNASMDNYKQGWQDFIDGLGEFTSTEFRNATLEERKATLELYAQNQFPLLTVGRTLGFEGPDLHQFRATVTNPDGVLAQRWIEQSPVMSRLKDQGAMGNTLADIVRGVYEGDEDLIRGTGANPEKIAKIASQYMIDNPNVANSADGRTGKDVLSFLEEQGSGQFVTEQIASEPGKFTRNKAIVGWLKDKVASPSLSLMADSLFNQAGDRRLEIADGRVQIERPEAQRGTTGSGSPMDIAASNAKNMDLANASATDQLTAINQLNSILSNSQMANAVGSSPQDLVNKINGYLDAKSRGENITGNTVTASDTEMTPVTEEQVSAAAAEAGVNPAIYNRLISTESNYGNSATYSSANAAGVAQFMAPTARDMGLRVDNEVDERLNSEKSLKAGAKYFKQQMDTFNDEVLATMAYNWGPGSVQEMLDSSSSDPFIPQETIDYAAKVFEWDDPNTLKMYLRSQNYIKTY